MDLMLSIYGNIIDNVEKAYPRTVQLIGESGAGKTSTAIKFGEAIAGKAKERGINLAYVYLNCKVDGSTRFVLYGNLIKKLVPKLTTRSLSPEEMLHQLVDHLQQEKRFLLIILDEIDYFIKTSPREHIIYDLTRIPELTLGQPSRVLGIILISRTRDWQKNLEPGEKSTLGQGVIEFPKYVSQQIRDILEDRVEEAFNPGAVSDEALGLVSEITADPPVNGDVRVGLDLLFYSGNLAENMGASRVLPDHVRKVFGETNPTVTTEDILNLDETKKIVLLALVRVLKTSNHAYATLRDIRESYLIVCEELNTKPMVRFEEQVQDLVNRGIIEMKSLTEIGVSAGSVSDIERFLNNLLKH